jgi:E-phenylitaconyl-CoA hydratase
MSIDVTRDGHVALLTINRPERLNALDAEHYSRLSEAWIGVRDDPVVRVAVVTGAGERSFSVGADLKSLIPGVPELGEFWLTQREQLLNRGLEVWKPIVAAVNGYCLGGGLTLLLATDVRIAASDATFGVPEVKRGVIPANGGTQRLAQQIPFARAMQLLLTGESIDAQTAHEWGIVNEVVAKERVLETAMDYAQRIAANAPLAVQAAKELAHRSCDVDLASGLRLEQAMARLLRGSADVQEGAKAFSEKRPPEFTGS